MNNFKEYGFEADFEGAILSNIEDYYIGYYVESYPCIKEKQKIPTFWNKNNGNCYKGAGVSNSKFSLKPIKKEMNREIKFRAWDERNKIMHNEVEFIRSGTGGDDWILFKSDKQKLEYGNVFNSPYFQQQIKIMQYVGLKDKNGKEIYIDDLIDLGYCFGKVVFNESDFGVPCYCIEDIEGGFQPFFEKDDYTKIWFEVIGNIYENPELLS